MSEDENRETPGEIVSESVRRERWAKNLPTYDVWWVEQSFKNALALIVCENTGIMWEEQCGHYACNQNLAEGYVIPYRIYRDSSVGSDLLCNYTCHLTDDRREIIANEIDECLRKNRNVSDEVIEKVEFNRNRILELEEGWVPVLVTFKGVTHNGITPDGSCATLDIVLTEYFVKEGYLCTGNCD